MGSGGIPAGAVHQRDGGAADSDFRRVNRIYVSGVDTSGGVHESCGPRPGEFESPDEETGHLGAADGLIRTVAQGLGLAPLGDPKIGKTLNMGRPPCILVHIGKT